MIAKTARRSRERARVGRLGQQLVGDRLELRELDRSQRAQQLAHGGEARRLELRRAPSSRFGQTDGRRPPGASRRQHISPRSQAGEKRTPGGWLTPATAAISVVVDPGR